MKTAAETICDFCHGPIGAQPSLPVGVAFRFSRQFSIVPSYASADLCADCEDLLTVAELRRILEKKIADQARTISGPVDASQGKTVG